MSAARVFFAFRCTSSNRMSQQIPVLVLEEWNVFMSHFNCKRSEQAAGSDRLQYIYIFVCVFSGHTHARECAVTELVTRVTLTGLCVCCSSSCVCCTLSDTAGTINISVCVCAHVCVCVHACTLACVEYVHCYCNCLHSRCSQLFTIKPGTVFTDESSWILRLFT
jgi:hypothetical protein